jgi:hypothetical protein
VGAGAHYLDLAAEQGAVQDIYRAYDELKWPQDLAVVPGMAFFGALADLLATAAGGDWTSIEQIEVAIGLDRWWPTRGTRLTGERNTATRLVVDAGSLVAAPQPPARREWDFPAPLGRQTVVATPLSEMVTMARHLPVSAVITYLSAVALQDLGDPSTPTPQALDSTGASAQRFVIDVVARNRGEVRRMSAAGRDIYAVTAPLVVEAASRLLAGDATVGGAGAPGEVFEAAGFLNALAPRHLTLRRA